MDRFSPEIDADHKQKCRVCSRGFAKCDRQITITQLIEKKFFELTQRELVISEEFAGQICSTCDCQLTEFCQFKESAIEFQERLFSFTSFIGEVKFKEEPNWEESAIIDSSLVNVSVKTEPEELHFVDAFHPESDEDAESESDESEQSESPASSPKATTSKPQPRPIDKELLNYLIGPNFIKCPECSKTVYRKKLDKHIQKYHRKTKTFFCDLCGHGTHTKHNLAVHIGSHVLGRKAKEQFKCDQCEFVTVTPMALHNHKRRIHLNEILAKRIHRCKECNLTFPTIGARDYHKEKVHGVKKEKKPRKKWTCQYCKMEFTHKHSMRFHQFQQHPAEMADDPNNEDNKEVQFTCAECSFLSSDKEQMKIHMGMHSGDMTSDKPICSCNQCGMTFLDEAKLYQHKQEHYKKKQRRLCDLCGKSCPSKTALTFHKKSKHGEKDMPCHICGKLFATENNLRLHLKQHGERKYICNFPGCDKSFIFSAPFREHLKAHTGIRDFVCEICSAAFCVKSQLKNHMVYVHGGLNFTCELCHNIYKRPDGLRTHFKRHHKDLTKDEVNQLMLRVKERT